MAFLYLNKNKFSLIGIAQLVISYITLKLINLPIFTILFKTIKWTGYYEWPRIIKLINSPFDEKRKNHFVK